MDKEELQKIIKEEGHYHAFEYKGYKCRILRRGCEEYFEQSFWLCGYIAIPKCHELYEVDFDEVDDNIDIHGGFTYFEDNLFLQPEKETWWIGFDCAHFGDISNLYHIEEAWTNMTYKTKEFVIKQLEDAIDQIIDKYEKKDG